MPDILHDFRIAAPADRVFEAVATPEGLDRWWTKRAAGDLAVGATWELFFGEAADWRAVVTRRAPPHEFELQLTRSDADWDGTCVGLTLVSDGSGRTAVAFRHGGWPAANAHFRISSYCWATYLRLLRRWLEHGEFVPYERRDEA